MEKEKDIKSILAQRKLLRGIIGSGIKFTVSYTVKVRQKGLLGFFRKKINEERNETFILKEPTLAVLDRASVVWLRMNTTEIDKEGADENVEGWKLVNAHSHDMAECLAILVLGEAYYAVEGGDNEEIERLTDLFYKTIKPSQANETAAYINAAANLTDFVSSIRLMKMSITTTPTTRIE